MLVIAMTEYHAHPILSRQRAIWQPAGRGSEGMFVYISSNGDFFSAYGERSETMRHWGSIDMFVYLLMLVDPSGLGFGRY